MLPTLFMMESMIDPMPETFSLEGTWLLPQFSVHHLSESIASSPYNWRSAEGRTASKP
jgi:hypothetical protein